MNERELMNTLSAVTPEDGMEQRILKKLSAPAPKPIRTMRRSALTLVAAVMLLTVGVFASDSQVWMWSSSGGYPAVYHELPTQSQCEADLGFTPVFIQSFENGYTFTKGSIGNNKLSAKDGNVLSQFKDLTLTYEKNGDTLFYHAYRSNPLTTTSGSTVATVNDIDLLYSAYDNKLVPEGYQMTAEDEASRSNGDLVFSYGSDRVEILRVQTLSWEQNGIRYSLQQLSGTLAVDDLIAMAAQLIAK